MRFDQLTFDDLKQAFRDCNTKLIMYIIMLANGELMDRCDKETLTTTEHNK